MKLEKEGPGIKITQSDSEIIKVVEGSGAARVIGAIILIGDALLAWSSGGKIMDLTFIFGVLLMLFGAAVATQRYVMTLNKLHGTWYMVIWWRCFFHDFIQKSWFTNNFRSGAY